MNKPADAMPQPAFIALLVLALSIAMLGPARSQRLDHSDISDVSGEAIDSDPLTRGANEKPASTFSYPALEGFNVIATPGDPFGSASAERALIAAKHLGANTIAIIPFFWQASPSSPDIRSGDDMSDDALRRAIQQTKKLGFTAIVKPQVWVPESWAGAIAPNSEESWHSWFSDYRAELLRIARIAAD